MTREEHYSRENRKERKQERKIVSSTDRSKFKKTDKTKYLDQLKLEWEEKRAAGEWLEGRVVSIVPQGIMVSYEGEKIRCILKGLLKREKTEAKNLVAVGDFVLFEKTGAPDEGIIAGVKPRHTILSRADNLSRRKEQLIAVNVDQLLIAASVVEPSLKSSLIDRYIIAARKGGLEPILVINKIDLLENQQNREEADLLEEVMRIYPSLGIPTVSVSVLDGRGVERLCELLSGKTSVFSGQSGVGKSSLINAITGLDLRIGDVVEKTKKGSHTTTYTQLIPLECGGWCVDTPGIKSFGVWNLLKEEIEGYFPEIHALGSSCKYQDCSHSHEEFCAVREALEEGVLSPIRYDSYLSLIASLEKSHQRR